MVKKSPWLLKNSNAKRVVVNVVNSNDKRREKRMTAKKFNKKEFIREVKANVKALYRKNLEEATQQQIFQAVSYAVKDEIIENWLATQEQYEKDDPKYVYYMSMEFLMGRALGNNMINLTIYDEVKEALEEIGLDINVIEDQEPDAALGNGGLGRLAACFLDSLATLGYPAYGCGIRYRYGMFKQKIEDGYQVEVPDNWLKDGNPFELRRPEYAKEVKFGGYVRVEYDEKTGRNYYKQEGYQSVRAIPYDFPIVGYNNNIVNTLRIWDAEAISEFQLDSFDKGDYRKAVEQENLARNIVEVLYPNDNHYAGKELRLKQQYFFISASVQEAIAKYKKNHDDVRKFYEKATFQLNDTHPTVAVAELMRILLDEEGLTWDEAWEVTTKTCAYTNHTIMSEALEKWPIELFSRLLPRVYQIIEEINRRFVAQIEAKYPGDFEKVRKMVKEAAKILDLDKLLDRKPKALSGGQRQRVAMGRAIVRDPKVFLMDEPLSNLDAKLRVQMRIEISKIHQRLGATIIYVTHDQTEAMTLGTRIVVMKDGVVQQVDSPQNLYNKPGNLFVAGFIGSPQMNFMDAVVEVSGKNVSLKVGQYSIKLPEAKAKALIDGGYAGKTVVMGIRPEDVHDAPEFIAASPDTVVESTIRVYELLGAEVFLYFDVENFPLTARVSPTTTARTGDTVKFALDAEKIHVFDKETEITITN